MGFENEKSVLQQRQRYNQIEISVSLRKTGRTYARNAIIMIRIILSKRYIYLMSILDISFYLIIDLKKTHLFVFNNCNFVP